MVKELTIVIEGGSGDFPGETLAIAQAFNEIITAYFSNTGKKVQCKIVMGGSWKTSISVFNQLRKRENTVLLIDRDVFDAEKSGIAGRLEGQVEAVFFMRMSMEAWLLWAKVLHRWHQILVNEGEPIEIIADVEPSLTALLAGTHPSAVPRPAEVLTSLLFTCFLRNGKPKRYKKLKDPDTARLISAINLSELAAEFIDIHRLSTL